MECPYFKNIAFEKIAELQKQDPAVDVEEISHQSQPFEEDPFQDLNDNIPEEGPTACLQHYESKVNKKKEQLKQENLIQSNKIISIKMPKILNVKTFQTHTESENIEDGDESIENVKKTHVFEIRNMTHLNIPFNIYHGVGILLPENKKYLVHLEMQILKITHYQNQKIKFFVELWKTDLKINQKTDEIINLIVSKKKNTQQITIKFFCIKEAKIFESVLMENYKNGKSKESQYIMEEPSESSGYDSYNFTSERMPYNEVFFVGDTFDIILFKNKSIMSKVQRFFTNSDFDHVALLMKTVNNQLLMLESTSNSGVAIYNFFSLRYLVSKKHFDRVGLRRYKGNRKDEYVRELQKFIQEVNGKKYKFDPLYLVSSSIQKNEEKTFFCSQLVAEALQTVGIMKKSKPSYKFLPKHFGQEDELNEEILQGSYSNIIIIQ